MGDSRAKPVPSPCQVLVQLDEFGNIVVDHEPVRTKRCGGSSGKKHVFWTLDDNTVGTYLFGANGIQFKATKNPYPPDEFPTGCRLLANGKKFKCEFPESGTGRRWAYDITLMSEPLLPKSTDPTVVND